MPLTRRSSLFALLMLLLAGCASNDVAMAPAPSSPAGMSMERALILSHAQQAIGTPYRLGGNSPDGLDCSGLVEMTYRAAGIRVPRTADGQFRALPQVDAPRPGDLLFFGDGNKAARWHLWRQSSDDSCSRQWPSGGQRAAGYRLLAAALFRGGRSSPLNELPG